MSFSNGINKRKWQVIIIPLAALTVSILISLNQTAAGSNYVFPWQLFFTVMLYTFCIWEVNLTVYGYLDKRIPFYENPAKRFLRQFFLSLIATILTFTILFMLMSLLRQEPFNYGNYFNFLIVASGISFSINALYVFKYLQASVFYRAEIETNAINEKLEKYLKDKNVKIEPDAAPKSALHSSKTIRSILIETGNQTKNILFDDIAYFKSVEGAVSVYTTSGGKMLTNYKSFASIAERLPVEYFFQLNRQIITHLNCISAVKDIENRKLIVDICLPQNKDIKISATVSRYRNAEFKQWFAVQLSKI